MAQMGHTLPAVDASGTPQPLNLDGAGNLKASITGAGSGGTSSVDEAAFSAGVSAGTPLMVYDTVSGELLIASATNRILNVAGSFSSSPPTSSTSSAVAQQTVGTSSGQVLASNGSRKGCAVQNTGTTVIFLGLGQTPTGSAYHVALPPGGKSNDGSSNRWDGTISGVLWQGAVNAISSGPGGTVVVTELT